MEQGKEKQHQSHESSASLRKNSKRNQDQIFVYFFLISKNPLLCFTLLQDTLYQEVMVMPVHLTTKTWFNSTKNLRISAS